MYLIRSVVNPLLEYTIVSSGRINKNGMKKTIAEGIFQECDVPNANGHTFPRSVITEAINNAKEEIGKRHFLGELDHPEDMKDVNRMATISLKDVSHVITSLELDGKYVVGRFETLETPNGLILSSLLEDNIKTGISIRALTNQDISYGDEINTINEFSLISYDAVHNPAYSDAYVKSVMASVFKLDNNFKANKLNISDKEFRDLVEKGVNEAIKRIYKNSKN